MTKQEKLNVKRSITAIKSSLFDDAWEDIVEDHPYVLQEDDDIEDDVEIIIQKTQTEPTWQRGKEKMKAKQSIKDKVYNSEMVSELSRLWGTDVSLQILNGFAIEEEIHLGFYTVACRTFINIYDRQNCGIVVTEDTDEQDYLIHLGYKRLEDLWNTKNN